MTVCVAALFADSRVIVCVADKAISYGDYIQWDSDSSKIAKINDRGIAVLISGGEDGISKVLGALLSRAPELGRSVPETLKICEEEYRKALDEFLEARFLSPRLLTKSDYVAGISRKTINSYLQAFG